ncbi:MAG TPA: glutamate--tRNA ligase [Syntrophorhabdales bacterium]|nr:glutamate--tRNA ligase [Syntrophorhabdales bacterium]
MIRTRFAPSPTGQLHIGGARTALFNWLFARHHKGKFVLRIEDTDRERSRDEYTHGILDGLAWLGIENDEGPFFQSTRMDLYKEYALRLLQEGHAYRCYCTAEQLEEKRKRALKEGQKPSYDRTCRERTHEEPGKPYVIRFKTPLSGTVGFDDLVRGEINFRCDELDDLVILRTDQTPTYNFTVVVDDALMGITHIIRGDDHINNTPRQIVMYEALKFAVPRFGHVPLIHGKDRARLSKRHGATSLLEYKEDGFLPEALMNYLARLGWAHGDDEIFSKEELIEKFDLPNVGKSPAIFDMDKLLWLNDHYMKTLPVEVIADRLTPFIVARGHAAPEGATLVRIIRNLLGRAKTLKEMAQMAGFFFGEEIEYEPSARAKFLTEAARPILERFLGDFRQLSTLDEADQRSLIESIARDYGKKLVDIVQPIRVALTGKSVSPGIFEVIGILGKDVVEKRMERAISSLS